jgi:putative transposase
MKKTRFAEEQMAAILREADSKPVPEVAKKHGVSAQTIYGWRKHFGTLEPADVKRLRQVEHENSRLKKVVADRDLEIDVLKEITRKNGRRTRAPAAGCVCTDARPVEPPRVRLALGRAVYAGIHVAPGGAGRARRGRDADAGGAVSPVRVPEDPDLPRPAGACPES